MKLSLTDRIKIRDGQGGHGSIEILIIESRLEMDKGAMAPLNRIKIRDGQGGHGSIEILIFFFFFFFKFDSVYIHIYTHYHNIYIYIYIYKVWKFETRRTCI